MNPIRLKRPQTEQVAESATLLETDEGLVVFHIDKLNFDKAINGDGISIEDVASEFFPTLRAATSAGWQVVVE